MGRAKRIRKRRMAWRQHKRQIGFYVDLKAAIDRFIVGIRACIRRIEKWKTRLKEASHEQT